MDVDFYQSIWFLFVMWAAVVWCNDRYLGLSCQHCSGDGNQSLWCTVWMHCCHFVKCNLTHEADQGAHHTARQNDHRHHRLRTGYSLWRMRYSHWATFTASVGPVVLWLLNGFSFCAPGFFFLTVTRHPRFLRFPLFQADWVLSP